MKKITFSAEDFRSIVYDIDTILFRLHDELNMAEEAIDEAARRFEEDETRDNWLKLNEAYNSRDRINNTRDNLRKLAEGLYSAAIALDGLNNENEQVLKTLGLI